MVGSVPYAEIIGSIYDSIEQLNTHSYKTTDTSDVWRRTRGALLRGQPGHHLEFWVDLGDIVGLTKEQLTHSSKVIFAVRYKYENEPTSQAILHSAIEAVIGNLARRCGNNTRTIPNSTNIFWTPDWAIVTINFQTTIFWSNK